MPRPIDPSYSSNALVQRLDTDFLEEDDVIVAVILEADVALVGPRAMLRLKIELALGHRLAFGVVGDGDVIEDHDRAWTIKRNEHGIPLGTGFAWARFRLGEGIERSGNVVFI